MFGHVFGTRRATEALGGVRVCLAPLVRVFSECESVDTYRHAAAPVMETVCPSAAHVGCSCSSGHHRRCDRALRDPWVSALWPFAWLWADAAGGHIVGITHSRHALLKGIHIRPIRIVNLNI